MQQRAAAVQHTLSSGFLNTHVGTLALLSDANAVPPTNAAAAVLRSPAVPTSASPQQGESVGMVLHMVGAVPVKEGTGRIARYELLPLEALNGRPRVDVICNMSGIFRLGPILHLFGEKRKKKKSVCLKNG